MKRTSTGEEPATVERSVPDSSAAVRPAAPQQTRRNLRATLRDQTRPGTSISGLAYFIIALIGFAGLLGVWSANSIAHYTDAQFLPSPADVLSQAQSLIADGSLWDDTRISFVRVMIGFLASVTIAVPLGLAIGSFRWAGAASEPSLEFARYMPVSAFVPLTIIWFGLGESQKWVIIFLGTFFVQVLMIADNVRRVPRQQISVAQTFGLGGLAIVRRVIFPSAAPGIWDTLRITVGWAWTWLILGELVAADSGLGYRVITAQRLFQTDVIFVVLIVVGILGLIIDQSMRFLGRRMFPGTKGVQS